MDNGCLYIQVDRKIQNVKLDQVLFVLRLAKRHISG